MWSAILKVVGRLIKAKVFSMIKVVRRYKNFKKISKWVKDWKTQKALLLEEIKRQKEILLKGSMKDKMKEYASDKFITKFMVYRDIQKDIEKSDYQKQKSSIDFAFEFPLLNRFKVLKTIWKEHLRLQKKYKDFLDKFERQLQRDITRQNKKQYQEFLKQDKKSKARIREYERYQRQNQMLMREEQYRLLRQIKQNSELLQQTLKTLAKQENNKNLLNRKENINTFIDFTNTLSTNERELFLKQLNNKSLSVVFNSSWIAMGIFIPHYEQREYYNQLHYWEQEKLLTNNTRGFMKIKVKKPSKINPSGVYMWWNVRYGDWKKIINVKTGKNFWKVWLKRNIKNMMYLLPNSKYWRSVRPYKPKTKPTKKSTKPKKPPHIKQISVVGRKRGLATGLYYSRFKEVKKRKKKK